MTARRLTAALTTLAMLASCAHVGEGADPRQMTTRIVREACLPFVLEDATADQVGRALGNWWSREWPDPFSPVPGTDFTRGGVTVTVDDGRQARQMNGELFPDPTRSCLVWMPRQDPEALAATVRAAIVDQPVLVQIQSAPHPTVRTLACGRSEGHEVVVQVRAVAGDRSGVIIRQTRTPVPDCDA